MAIFLLWIVYLGFGAAVLALVRWLGRPLPSNYAVAVLVLPVAFCGAGFFRGQTPLPIDHVHIFTPWTVASDAAPRNANLNDAATQIAPWAKAVRMAWKDRSFPWRNRWNGCGMALAGNGQSAAFSPLTLLMFSLPLAHAFTLAVAVKLFLALTGVWLWLREMALSPLAALFGAVSFAFSMAMTPWLLFTLSGVLCLWPWALFAIERIGQGGGAPAAWLLVVIVAISILAGHPESVVLGALFAGLFMAVRLLPRDHGFDRRHLAKVLTAALLALGLTGFLWVPQSSAIRASNRYAVAKQIRQTLPVTLAPHGPAWRYGVLTSIFPRILGDDFTSPKLSGAAAGSFPEMAFGYFGIVGWAMALQLARPGARRDTREWALAAVLICGLAVGTGTWPLFDAFLTVPFVQLVLPLRFLSWVALAGSAIAAFEIDRLARADGAGATARWLRLAAPVFLAVAVMLAFVAFRAQHAATGGLGSQRQALGVSLGALAVAILAMAIWGKSPHRERVAGTLLLAAAAGELFLQGARLYRWGPPDALFPPTPLVGFLQAQPGPFRIVGEGAALFPNTNVFAGVENVETHDAVERRDYVEFLDATCGYDPKPYFKHIRNLDAPVLDFLNVKYLVTNFEGRKDDNHWKLVYSGQDGRVFENRHALARVFAPRQIRFEGEASALSQPNRSDWSESATVRGHPDVVGDRVVLAQNLPVAIEGYREATDSVAFEARSSAVFAKAILVTSLVQDGGWTARDESGQDLTTVRANGVFLGLVLPTGRHGVRLAYSPPNLGTGLALSLASSVVLVSWLWRRRRMGSKETP